MGRLSLVGATFWNRRVYSEVRELVRRHRAQVVHFHNTFPLISPAAYKAAHAEGAAVVQTLHNFRLLCTNAVLFRDGQVCERCIGKAVAWPGVVNTCYRGSRGASAVVAAAMATHRLIGTWNRSVDLFITPSAFARQKLVEGGLPAEKIVVKPNCVHPDPGCGNGRGGYAVFVGRLSPEKGLRTLLRAWSQLAQLYPLKIIGDGELAPMVQEAAARSGPIEWLGRQSATQVSEIVGEASFLVLPSECYETFGRVIIEAFAKGTPAIASQLGAIPELVEPGKTGLLFRPGDANNLAAQVQAILNDPARLACMRRAARAAFIGRYSGRRNSEELTSIYERAIAGLRKTTESGALSPAQAVEGMI